MRWRPLAVGLGAYLIGLAATAPATLVDAGLQRASDGKLRLAEAQGTLWSGAGQIEIRAADGRVGIAKSIAWRFLPLFLLRGQLVCEIALDQASRNFPVKLSFTGLEFANVDIDLPAMALGLAMPKLAALSLSGDVSLHVDQLLIVRNGAHGNAILQWHGAGSALTTVAPLGDYELRVEFEGTSTRAALHTLQGPLQLDGKGAWSNDVAPDFPVAAHVSRQYQQQLVPLLQLVAVDHGEGNFVMSLR